VYPFFPVFWAFRRDTPKHYMWGNNTFVIHKIEC
ncbi:MAG: hypothetical protein RL431_606, partial [Actinomycetota bacterium]